MALLATLKLTQQEIESGSGVNRARISLIVNGKAKPSRGEETRIAVYFDKAITLETLNENVQALAQLAEYKGVLGQLFPDSKAGFLASPSPGNFRGITRGGSE